MGRFGLPASQGARRRQQPFARGHRSVILHLILVSAGAVGALGAGIRCCWALRILSRQDAGPSCAFIRLGEVFRSSGSSHPTVTRRSSHSFNHFETGAGNVVPGDLHSVASQKVRYLLAENPFLFEDALERELSQLEHQRLHDAKHQEAQDDLHPSFRERVGEVRLQDRQNAAAELLHLAAAARLRLSAGVRGPEPLLHGGELQLPGGSSPEMLEVIHSVESLKAVEDHLSKSLAPIVGAGLPGEQLVYLPLVNMGQAYAASILFGYVLRRAEQRLQLEKMIGTQSAADAGGSLERYIAAVGPGDFQDTMSTLEVQLAAEAHVQALFGDLKQLHGQLQEVLVRVAGGGGRGDRLREAVQQGEIAAVQARAHEIRYVLAYATAFGAELHRAEGEAQKVYQLTPACGSRLDRIGVDTDDTGNPVVPP